MLKYWKSFEKPQFQEQLDSLIKTSSHEIMLVKKQNKSKDTINRWNRFIEHLKIQERWISAFLSVSQISIKPFSPLGFLFFPLLFQTCMVHKECIGKCMWWCTYLRGRLKEKKGGRKEKKKKSLRCSGVYVKQFFLHFALFLSAAGRDVVCTDPVWRHPCPSSRCLWILIEKVLFFLFVCFYVLICLFIS